MLAPVTLNQPAKGTWMTFSTVRLKDEEEKPSTRAGLPISPADPISREWVSAFFVCSVPAGATGGFTG